ncbi:MAG: DUF1559 domain-containing protein [Planctomycetia bacterium]|jgi:hypothetical protein
MLRSSRQGITFIEVVVTLGVLGFLFILFIIWVGGTGGGAREPARRSACTNKLKQIGLGLQNFANARKRFPGSSSSHWDSAELGNEATGYSWQTMILPYIEEGSLYKRLDLKGDPWSTEHPEVLNDPDSDTNIQTNCHPLVWSTSIDTYLCPSRAIDSDRIQNSPYPDSINKVGGVDTTPAATSYVALSATHFASLAGTEESPWAGGNQHPNGVMYPGSKTSFRNLKDGSSNTAIVCETKEPTYSAWYEGATAGVVGLKTVDGFEKFTTEDGYEYGIPVNATVALNYGNPDKNQYYCNGDKPFENISKWTYGPSSDHPGVILHLFGDGSVHSFTQSISPDVYMHLITRNGGEPIHIDD